MPYGLQLILGAMGGCIHDEDPISLLDIDENIEILKNKIKETGYIDSLINNSFITNNHRLLFELKADPKFNDKENLFYKEYLKQKSEDLDESSKEDLKKLSLKLDARQNQVDDESILPKVEKEDIPATKLFPKVSISKYSPKKRKFRCITMKEIYSFKDLCTVIDLRRNYPRSLIFEFYYLILKIIFVLINS